jgi:cephalosporin hydroxylase
VEGVTDPVAASVARWREPHRPAYRGIYTQQLEPDLERYAEIIAELAPPFIVEIGRAEGGTAVWLADHLADANRDGVLVSIDILTPERLPPTLAKVIYITASSTDVEAIAAARDAAVGGRGLVLLDGDHSSAQVTRELAIYADLAAYLIVEDTIMGALGYDDGPHVALADWLPDHPEFVQDPDPILTQHPGGWLRRRNP